MKDIWYPRKFIEIYDNYNCKKFIKKGHMIGVFSDTKISKFFVN
jgi:hypothetical protein